MKLVFQSNSGPYALARRQIVAALSVLPDRLLRRVDELVLVGERGGADAIEHLARRRLVLLCIPGDSHDPQARERALRELLLGFARLESGDAFGEPLDERRRSELETRVDEWYPRCFKAMAEVAARSRPAHLRRLMYIEYKGDGLVGPARIGWVTFSKSGRSLEYAGRRLRSLSGSGFKANYIDEETGEKYWISGCKHDGTDALYSTTIEIDEDAREEYWVRVRGLPESGTQGVVRTAGKHST